MENLVVNRLSNQLPLFIRKAKKAPVVTLQVWVRTGSADELPNEAGLSHFIEHLVFKGTESFKAGEIAKKVEEAGGELNAYTSFDQTVFYVSVPKAQVEVAAQVLSDMVSCPLFDPVEVDNEREVVIEEIKMGLDQPTRVASKMLFKQMFRGYSYENPVIGFKENIERVSVEEIKDYFDERYVAENMALVCVGDIEEKEVFNLAEKYFSKLSTLPLKEKRMRDRGVLKLSNDFLNVQKSGFEKDYFYISWPVEGFKSKASEAYELLALILGQGESSFLYKKLKIEKDLCRSVGASYFGSDENGIFVISGVAQGDELDGLLKALPLTLEEFMSQENLDKDLAKARNLFSSEHFFAEESIAAQSRTIGEDWLYYDKAGETEKRRDRILKLNLSDLSDSLNLVFSKTPYVSLLSRNDEKDLVGFQKNLSSLSLKKTNFSSENKIGSNELALSKSKSIKNSYHEWKTESGSSVHFLESSESQVVSLKIGFEGGELIAPSEKEGLVSLFGSCWSRDFKTLKESEVTSILDYYSSGLGAFSGKHSSGLSLYTLGDFFPKVSHLLGKSLTEANFSGSLLDREKASKVHHLESIKDRPAHMAFKAFSKMIFKGNFYSRDSIGNKDYIQSAQVQDLEAFLKQTLSQRRLYSVVGALDKSSVLDTINSLEALLPQPSEVSLYESQSFSMPAAGEVKEILSDKNQSHIVLGYPSFRLRDEEKLYLDMASAILGGQGGRLFIELRDKASLAYSVAPIEHSAYFGGYFGAYIACDPSKKKKAISMMKDELGKMASHKVSEHELNWMKNQVLGKQAMALQRNSFIADTMLFDSLYGFDARDYMKLEDKLSKVSAEDIRLSFEKILSGPEFLVTVG